MNNTTNMPDGYSNASPDDSARMNRMYKASLHELLSKLPVIYTNAAKAGIQLHKLVLTVLMTEIGCMIVSASEDEWPSSHGALLGKHTVAMAREMFEERHGDTIPTIFVGLSGDGHPLMNTMLVDPKTGRAAAGDKGAELNPNLN